MDTPVIVKENDRFRLWKGNRRWSIDPIGTSRLLIYKTKREALAAWERLNAAPKPTQQQKDAALQNFRCAVAAMERGNGR